MDSRQRPYQFARDGLLSLHESLIELSDDAAAAEEWVMPFSDLLNLVVLLGLEAGLDAYTDPPVATLLEDVRSRLSKYATVAWIEHSPFVVAGMEEMLRKTASQADFKIIGEYARRVKEGSMTRAEFDKHFDSILTTGPDLHHDPPSSVPVSQPSLQTAPPTPTNSGGSVPSSSFAPHTSPAVVANPPEVTVRPAPNPVRQAAVASSSSRFGASPAGSAGTKRRRSPERGPIQGAPSVFVRCDTCARSKVKCEELIGADPAGPCKRCTERSLACVRESERARRLAPIRAAAVSNAEPARKADPAAPAPAAVSPSGLPVLSSTDYASLLAFNLQGPAAEIIARGPFIPGVPASTAFHFWLTEVARCQAAAEAASNHLQFSLKMYNAALGRALEQLEGQRPALKRARIERKAGPKGIGKAQVDPVDEDGPRCNGKARAEPMDEDEDEEGAESEDRLA